MSVAILLVIGSSVKHFCYTVKNLLLFQKECYDCFGRYIIDIFHKVRPITFILTSFHELLPKVCKEGGLFYAKRNN